MYSYSLEFRKLYILVYKWFIYYSCHLCVTTYTRILLIFRALFPFLFRIFKIIIAQHILHTFVYVQTFTPKRNLNTFLYFLICFPLCFFIFLRLNLLERNIPCFLAAIFVLRKIASVRSL